MRLHRPFRPWYVTQKWGIKNPAYEQFGFSRHNGIDVAAIYVGNPPKQLQTWPIYCPADGFRVYGVYDIPRGAGREIALISKTELDLPTGRGHLYLSFMHNAKVLVPAGYEPAIGELIAVGDNTGFSTGPHSHIGGYRVDAKGRDLDKNDASNSFDIEPLFLSSYAADQASLSALIKSNFRYYKYLAGL